MQFPLAMFLLIRLRRTRSADCFVASACYRLAHTINLQCSDCKCLGLIKSFRSDRPCGSFSGIWLYGFSGEKGLEGLLTPRTTTSSSSTSSRATCRAAVWFEPLPISVQPGLAGVTHRKWYDAARIIKL